MAASSDSYSDGIGPEPGPDVSTDRALSALGDPICREILVRVADGPRTASELAADCDLPSTTLYRKLGMLVDGGLVAEGTEIATDGRNATLYRPCVDDLAIHIDAHDGIELEAPADDDP